MIFERRTVTVQGKFLEGGLGRKHKERVFGGGFSGFWAERSGGVHLSWTEEWRM